MVAANSLAERLAILTAVLGQQQVQEQELGGSGQRVRDHTGILDDQSNQ